MLKKVYQSTMPDSYFKYYNREAATMEDLKGYVCFYRGKRYECEATTSYKAQQLIAKKYKIKKAYEINVVLAWKDGKEVTHTPVD